MELTATLFDAIFRRISILKTDFRIPSLPSFNLLAKETAMACAVTAFHSLAQGDKFLLMSAIQFAGGQRFENVYLFEKTDVNMGMSDIGHTEAFEASRPVLKLP